MSLAVFGHIFFVVFPHKNHINALLAKLQSPSKKILNFKKISLIFEEKNDEAAEC